MRNAKINLKIIVPVVCLILVLATIATAAKITINTADGPVTVEGDENILLSFLKSLAGGGITGAAVGTGGSSLACEVTTSCDGYEIFRISDLTNAHAQLLGQTTVYNNTICCNTAADSSGNLLKLSAQTNAQVQDPDVNTYTYSVGLDADCDVKTSCAVDEICVVSIGNTTNAHVQQCGGTYAYDVCCKLACTNPITLTSNTVLDRDYNFCGNGFTLGANDITLDCAEHILTGSGGGISVAGVWAQANGVTIKNCIIDNFGVGVYLNGQTGNTVVDNEIKNNLRHGIFARNIPSNHLIEGNTLTNNNENIVITENAAGITVQDNTISGGSRGIQLSGNANNNLVVRNTISGSSAWNIITYGTSNNKFYYNNVNDSKAYDTTTTNKWDDGVCAGNYYGTSTPTTPYPITGGSIVDNYPLSQVWPDGYDTNNNGQADCSECSDNDGDGYLGTPAGCGDDCDDNDASVYPGAPDAICDGVDNDCDGTPDDDYVPTPTTCGIGECANTGQLICQNGAEVDTCTAGTPTDEICDGLDNDCDGTIDNKDSDGDGLNDCDGSDKCADTTPWYAEQGLKPNHYDSSNWNIASAYGCSCAQVLYCKPGGNNGEYKFGCSEGTKSIWETQSYDSWALDCQLNGVVAMKGVDKSLFENTDGSGWPDIFSGDNDNDGVGDGDDDMIDDQDPPGDPDYGIPDWHPKSKHKK